MSDSIHAVRWIRQVADIGWDLHLFPSWSQAVHPEHRNITIHGCDRYVPPQLDASVKVRDRWPLPWNLGLGVARLFFPWLLREKARLAALIDELRPNVVHSLEIQHGGYLALGARERCHLPLPPWMVTNWGSDIQLFKSGHWHRKRIQKVLASCDYYDCECERDIREARELGFSGHCFPPTPNAGGFDLAQCLSLRVPGPTSQRRWILLKGYQHWAGLALAGLNALERCASCLRDYTIGIFSASRSVAREAERVRRRSGLRIEVLPKLSHVEMLQLHGKARISIGISKSDGASTSMLEAIAMGSFPIQTCTACADEWIVEGISGLIVPPDDIEVIAQAIRKAVTDNALVDRAAALNWHVAETRLDAEILRKHAVEMYRFAADRRKQ
jgi:glycosyltransferase involved in cell wall biosynthesis